MGQADEFCRHPGDPEGCKRSLVEALMGNNLDKHCVWTGLEKAHPQCRRVIVPGLLADGGHSGAGRPVSGVMPLTRVCQEVVHMGYQRDFLPTKDVFVEAYEGLIRRKLRRYPEFDQDDLLQNVYVGMERRLRNPDPITGSLTAYVGTAVYHAVGDAIEDKGLKKGRISIESSKVEVPSEEAVPAEVLRGTFVELWERSDRALVVSGEADFLDRVIFAQGFVLGCEGEKRAPTVEVLATWRRLSELAPQDAESIASEARVRFAQAPGISAVSIASDMLREGRLEPWQLPIVLGMKDGMTVQEILSGFEGFAQQTVNYVDQRVLRIRRILAEYRRFIQPDTRE